MLARLLVALTPFIFRVCFSDRFPYIFVLIVAFHICSCGFSPIVTSLYRLFCVRDRHFSNLPPYSLLCVFSRVRPPFLSHFLRVRVALTLTVRPT